MINYRQVLDNIGDYPVDVGSAKTIRELYALEFYLMEEFINDFACAIEYIKRHWLSYEEFEILTNLVKRKHDEIKKKKEQYRKRN